MTLRITLLIFLLSIALSAQTAELCSVTRRPIALPGLPEDSGVAASRRTPGLLWTHNDSGTTQLVAIDAASGAIRGTVRITGADSGDWEDVSVARCGSTWCLYIADIGDNARSRRQITIHRVPEPAAADAASAPAETLRATYPDRARDAEAVFVTAAGDIYIITKDAARATALYRLPRTAPAGTVSRLEFVSPLRLTAVTDADLSPDGEWVAVRSNTDLYIYPAAALMAGRSPEPRHVDLKSLREPKGEGVTFGDDGVVYLTGEGNGRSGTFAALACRL